MINEKVLQNIKSYNEQKDNYPTLKRAAVPLLPPSAPVLGREHELRELRLGLRNPEKANVILLGEPGSGKSAIVQGLTYDDSSSNYLTLSVDIERLAEDSNGDKDAEIANGLLNIAEETAEFSKKNDIIVILFIDEFHRIKMLSPTAIETMKPILEKSAHNGIRIIGATTFEEYNEHIAGNRALDQRMLRMDLPELKKEAVINILQNRAKQHNVLQMSDPDIFEEIYNKSREILISNSQPRASIDILMNMIGTITTTEYMKNGKLIREYATPHELHINSKYSISHPILNRVIQRSYGIDIDNNANIKEVREALNTRIFNQSKAVSQVLSRLEMSLAGFNDTSRPKISFLSTGSTGVGKSLRDNEPIPTPTKNGYTLNGDLKVGDYVYNRYGKPVKVTGVYHKGLKDVYRLILTDGRYIDCAEDHLWTYKSRFGNGAKYWKTLSTKELMKKKIATPQKNGRINYQFVIPQNCEVERELINYNLDPYALGAFIGNGYLCQSPIQFSSDDIETVEELSQLLNLPYKKKRPHDNKDYYWLFVTGKHGTKDSLLQVKDALQEVPELINKKSEDKFIPDIYKYGSIEQRWALIQGLFDTDGTIQNISRYNVSYSTTSKRLAEDIQEVLWSLGIMTSINAHSNKRDWNDSKTFDYHVHVKVQNKDKYKFFRLKRKLDRAYEAQKVVKKREKKFDTIAIKSIEKLDYQEPMTCIMVDDPEHLYLAGKGHIVTHNTEMAKVITEVLHIPLKRFDMSRYPRPEDAVEFADQLANAAWSAPNAYILIDEAEKSTRQCMNTLLQVLDDAQLTSPNNPNRVISFTGNIINLTTNLGSEVYQHQKRYGEQDQDITEVIYDALKDSPQFETAVLGRIDAIVPFNPLPQEAIANIANRELRTNLDIAETDKRTIFISPDILPYIVIDKTSEDTERGGARDAKRNMKNIVIGKLASYLSEGKPECPLIIRLDQTPRFRDVSIVDPNVANVVIEECYDNDIVDSWLKSLSQKINKPLQNKGLFIPKTMSPNDVIKNIIELIKTGSTSFKSTVDITKTIIIDGDDSLDIANVSRYLK